MAEGLLNELYGDHYKAYSAGTDPTIINPYAVKVMADRGIDISKNRSKDLDEFKGMEFDYVITVCEEDTCPYFSGGKNYIHHSFKDPTSVKGDDDYKIETFTTIRNQIEQWIKKNLVVMKPEKIRGKEKS